MGKTAHELRDGMRQVVQRVGPWERDNIYLGEGVYTIAPDEPGISLRVARVMQIAGDLIRQDWATLRVLDLGAAEGFFAVEFARRGASVVAIEAREPHVERMRFVRDALELDALEVVRGDVRDIDAERFGTFDLVLCLGILYHLDSPDIPPFLRALRSVCRHAVIVDTRFAVQPRVEVREDARSYWGWKYREHASDATPDERAGESRASIDNAESFWPTRRSLYNLLADAGFTTVLEARIPRADLRADRFVLVALSGAPVALESAPRFRSLPAIRWGETEKIRSVAAQRGRAFRVARRVVPPALRQRLSRLVTRLRRRRP